MMASDWEIKVDQERNVDKNGGNKRRCGFDPSIPLLLPHENMYKLQVGSKLFEISGASLSSDGPSFFTEYFSRRTVTQGDGSTAGRENGGNMSNVLFIDRSADTFEIIYKHLQGYYIDIQDEVQFTMLYADAMYYNFPRLRSILKEYEYYFANISGKTFKVAKSLFSRDGDSPNYFSMLSSAMYADVHEQVFLNKKLIRPPPQSAPYISRSPAFFEDILKLLCGAVLELDDKMRESLIKECKYYRFLNLEQRLVKCKINYNPLTHREDILIPLNSITKNKLEFPVEKTVQCYARSNGNQSENSTSPQDDCESDKNNCDSDAISDSEPALKKLRTNEDECDKNKYSWKICTYKRPYLDKHPRDLIFQIDSMETSLIFNKRKRTIHVALINEMAHLFESVFGSILNKMGINLGRYKVSLPAKENVSKRMVYLVLPACISICDLKMNGKDCSNVRSIVSDGCGMEQVLDFTNIPQVSYCAGKKLHLSESLWRLGVNNGQMMMIALKANAFTGTKEYSKLLGYL